MNKIDKLELIKKTVKKHKITAYEISQGTKLSSVGVQKIINEQTKKPNENTLDAILQYLEKSIVGVDYKERTNSEVLKFEEPTEPISKITIRQDRVVPYYDIEIAGTIISSFDDAKEYIKFYVDYEPLNDCSAFLPYAGDSMLPKYKSGDTLGVKQIKNLEVILWGEAYLVITGENANNYKTVKNIYSHQDPSKVILRAINPEYHGDTIINKEDILSLFIVKGKIELNQI